MNEQKLYEVLSGCVIGDEKILEICSGIIIGEDDYEALENMLSTARSYE